MLNDDARPKLNPARPSPAPIPTPDDGIRKSAILIASLDPPTAETLFAELPLELAAQVRAALRALGEVDPSEREQIFAEFLDASRDAGPEPEASEPAPVVLKISAVEFATNSAPVAVPALSDVHRQAVRVVFDEPLPAADEFLHEPSGQRVPAPGSSPEPAAPPIDQATAHLARGLEHEHAQTICQVLAQLPAPRAADLLQCLSPGRQAEVLRRLDSLEAAAPEVLQSLSEALQPWGPRPPGDAAQRSVGSPPAAPGFPPPAGTNAAAASPPTRRHADRSLACAAEPGEATQVTEFDDLVRLDHAALARVFAAAEPATVLLALSGANRDLINRIVRHLPASAGRTLRRQLESLGPTRLRDIELAQQQLAELAGQMCREGLIHLPRRRRFTMAA